MDLLKPEGEKICSVTPWDKGCGSSTFPCEVTAELLSTRWVLQAADVLGFNFCSAVHGPELMQAEPAVPAPSWICSHLGWKANSFLWQERCCCAALCVSRILGAVGISGEEKRRPCVCGGSDSSSAIENLTASIFIVVKGLSCLGQMQEGAAQQVLTSAGQKLWVLLDVGRELCSFRCQQESLLFVFYICVCLFQWMLFLYHS